MKLKEAQMLGILALLAVGVILLCMWSGEEEAEEAGSEQSEAAQITDVSAEADVVELYESIVGDDGWPDVGTWGPAQEVDLEIGGIDGAPVAQPSEDARLRDLIEENRPDEIPIVPAERRVAEEQRRSEPEPLPEIIHVVQKGETLSHISQKYYGTSRSWRVILDANKRVLTDPRQLRPDMKLMIPPLETAVAASSRPLAISAVATADKAPSRTYTVKKNDTLFRIAMRCYDDGTRWKDILAANRHQLSDPRRDLRPGMKLVMP
ncbi:MAG: LysM peptidoglycan-binding domain-containing protein [Candidatus Brocadiae bacterium]|nr:LysM peptidoglycan-binding domain-containing protein [Candidatus Brocadiia bacterium]